MAGKCEVVRLVLTEAEIHKLLDLSERLGEHFREFQDVEWSIDVAGAI